MNTGHTWELPGYEIGEVLGRGGFATVFKAQQLSLGRPVAVKVLTTDISSPADRRRFDRERDALARLSTHPHVVDVYDAGVSGGRPYIVMRLYKRGTLANQVATTGPLPVPDVVEMVGKLAQALQAAHAQGIVHRDIKPENVLLDDAGEPVLSDFGIAAIVDPDGTGSLTHASTNFFTMAHVAPEVLEGQHYSTASDIYALASTAYMALAGRPAFDPRNPRVTSMILDAPPPPIERADLPQAVMSVLTRAMAKNPQERFPSAAALAEYLRTAAAEQPDPGHAPSRAGRPDASTVVAQPLAPTAAVPAVPMPGPPMPTPPMPITRDAPTTLTSAIRGPVQSVAGRPAVSPAPAFAGTGQVFVPGVGSGGNPSARATSRWKVPVLVGASVAVLLLAVAGAVALPRDDSDPGTIPPLAPVTTSNTQAALPPAPASTTTSAATVTTTETTMSEPDAEVSFDVVDELGDFEEREQINLFFQGRKHGTFTVTRDSPKDRQSFTASHAGVYSYELDALIHFYDSDLVLQKSQVNGQGTIEIHDGDVFRIYLVRDGGSLRVALRNN